MFIYIAPTLVFTAVYAFFFGFLGVTWGSVFGAVILALLSSVVFDIALGLGTFSRSKVDTYERGHGGAEVGIFAVLLFLASAFAGAVIGGIVSPLVQKLLCFYVSGLYC